MQYLDLFIENLTERIQVIKDLVLSENVCGKYQVYTSYLTARFERANAK